MERFKIKNFYHLLDYDFHIPSFQRGYRWNKKQVIDLLNDLKEFYLNKSSKFYCLQPIVVKHREDGGYDVLDGQQRLTTIYLILSYLENTINENIGSPKLFSLQFETRDEGNFIAEKKFSQCDDGCKRNIDFFYIRKAYEVIDEWFDANRQSKTDISKLLAAPPQDGDDENLRDARVIWYEINSSGEDAIEVFSRLNYGKICLTEAELIKALILQCDVYGKERKKYKSQWALKVAADWDRIERELNDPNFWAMLATDDQQKKADISLFSRISIILEFVANYYLYHFNPESKSYEPNYVADEYKEIKVASYDTRFVYEVINQYLLGNGIRNKETYEQKVEKLWEYILDTFAILKDWYNNHRNYHLIGLLRLLQKKDEKLLFSLFVKYMNEEKEKFDEYIVDEIGREVKIKSKSKVNGETINNTLSTINYIENREEIIKILELFNVHLMIESHQDSARFDFATFRKQNVTSLEHIHPQNLEETDISFKDLKEWIDRKKEDWYEDGLKDAFDMLNSLDEKIFNDKRETWMSCVRQIDSRCNELAEIDEEIMHSIKNLALIDKDTNAALQNYLLDKKRNKLKKLSEENEVYVPIGTWHVFNKFFSKNVSELKFWGEEDRDAYFEKLEKVYNLYIK